MEVEALVTCRGGLHSVKAAVLEEEWVPYYTIDTFFYSIVEV